MLFNKAGVSKLIKICRQHNIFCSIFYEDDFLKDINGCNKVEVYLISPDQKVSASSHVLKTILKRKKDKELKYIFISDTYIHYKDVDTSLSIKGSVLKTLASYYPEKYKHKIQNGEKYALHYFGFMKMVSSLYNQRISNMDDWRFIKEVERILLLLFDMGIITFTKIKTVGLTSVIEQNALSQGVSLSDIEANKTKGYFYVFENRKSQN